MTRVNAKKLDPVLLPVIANRLDGICREMTNTLLRSGRSAILNTARDFSCAIVTTDNDLLSSAEGLPIHVIGMEFLAETMHELHPDFREGDAYIHNDPYRGNTHHADQTIIVPVFHRDEHVFTVCAKAHQADIGCSIPTTYFAGARDVYEEGALSFPCVQIQREYRDIDDIIRMARMRIRVPDQWYGDYLAALGACRIAERRLEEAVVKYGRDTIVAFIEQWFDYSEQRMVQAIREMPRASLKGVGAHDPFPGIPDGLPLTVGIEIDPEEGKVTVDLRDNPDCVPSGINESGTTAIADAAIGVFNSLDSDVPHNAGSFRRIEVLTRENCVAGIPLHPTSCSAAANNVGNRLVNIIQSTLAELGDGIGLAEGALGQTPALGVISGRDSRRDMAPFVNQILLASAGGPGGPYCDGWVNYLMPAVNGLCYRDSIEICEQKYPLHVFEQRLIPDSEGAGRHRGAPGCRSTYGPKSDDLTVVIQMEGRINVPRGVRQGLPALGNSAWKENAEGARLELPPIAVDVLRPGERLVSLTSGGGGYGSPLERESELVLEDVREGWISAERAQDVYGCVIVGDSPMEMTVDVEATHSRRSSLSKGSSPTVLQ